MAKATILIVDDEEDIRELVELYLLREGYETAVEIVGRDNARKLVVDNPMSVVRSQLAPGGGKVVTAMLKMRAANSPALALSVK